MGSGEGQEKSAEELVMEERKEVKKEGGNVFESGEHGDDEMRDVEPESVGNGKKEETEENVEKKGAEEQLSNNGNRSNKEKQEMKEEDEKRDDKEEEEEEDEESDEKEPVTPMERPTRERRTVERYSERSVARSATPKGSGMKLSEIPNVAYKLSKRKPDDILQLLHTILFGKKAKVQMLKRNIGQFSGYVWSENEEKQKAKVKEKIEKCVKEKLVEFCYVLDIPINKATIKKEDLSFKLMEFLQSPHATTDALLSDADQKNKRKRKVTPTRAEESSGTQAKKRKASSEASKKQKKASKVEEREELDSEEVQHDIELSEEVETDSAKSEDNEPKKKSARRDLSKKKARSQSGVFKETTSAKSTMRESGPAKKGAIAASGSQSNAKGSTSKKQAVEKKEVQDKDKTKKNKEASKSPAKSQGRGRAKKSYEPDRDELHAVVVNILKEVDFDIATLSDILRQLGTHFDVDLLHRKAEIKEIITEVISNMTDDEEDENEESANQEKKEEQENKESREPNEEEKDKSDHKENGKDNEDQEQAAGNQ